MPKMNLGNSKGRLELGKPKKKGRAEPKTEFQQAMRNAEKQFKFNTSDNFYVCLCFMNYDEQREFFELVGMDNVPFLSGYDFQEKAQAVAVRKHKLAVASNKINCLMYNDVVSVLGKESYSSLSEAALDEIRIVVDFMDNLEVQENPQFVVDSGIYNTVVWRDDDDKDKACADLGLLGYMAGKFVDTSRVLRDWSKQPSKS